jgi:cytochrome d ubiquinol oxidase subunit I
MNDFGAVVTNPVLLITFPHTLLGAYLTGGLFVLAVSGYHLLRGSHVATFAPAARMAVIWSFAAALLLALTGHIQGQVMTQVQPMKMAAAEALYHTASGAPFSLFAIGTPDGKHLIFDATVPHLLSVLATNTWNGQVQGIDDLQAAYRQAYGPGDYSPIIPVTYWTFRTMVGADLLLLAFAAVGLWLLYRRRLETSRWFHRAALVAVFVPFLANWTGWTFTEMGRQPWVVFGLQRTAAGVSPSVGLAAVATSLGVFTLLYGLLAIADGYLLVRVARRGPVADGEEADHAALPSF